MRADQHGRNQYSPATSLRKSVDKWMSEHLSTLIHNPCMQLPYRNPWSNRRERYAADSRSSVPISENRRPDIQSRLRFSDIVVSTGSVWNRSVLDDGFACRSARSEILNFRDLQNRNGHWLFRAAFFGDFDLFVIDGVIGMQHDVAAETVIPSSVRGWRPRRPDHCRQAGYGMSGPRCARGSRYGCCR